jgi:hypothetical protein
VRDVRFAVDRCRSANCSIGWLGVGTDLLLSHAYYLSPSAARALLRLTSNWCNLHKQDYALRRLCTSGSGATCHAPPRGLYRPDPLTLGWGLFVQDHRQVPSFHTLVGWTGGGRNFSEGSAEQFAARRCDERAAMQGNLTTSLN